MNLIVVQIDGVLVEETILDDSGGYDLQQLQYFVERIQQHSY
jgi:hypothetical protein